MSETSNTHFSRARSRSMSRGPAIKKARALSESSKSVTTRSLSRGRSVSAVPRDEQGVRDVAVSHSNNSKLEPFFTVSVPEN